MPIHRVERCWTKFIAQQIVDQQSHGGSQPIAAAGRDPGVVYFNDAGNGKTEVTIEIEPDAVVDADEQELNGRVDSYLDTFKRFAEEQ